MHIKQVQEEICIKSCRGEIMSQFFSFSCFLNFLWLFFFDIIFITKFFYIWKKSSRRSLEAGHRADGTWELAPARLFQDVGMAILGATRFWKMQCRPTQITHSHLAIGGLLLGLQFPDSESRPLSTGSKLAQWGLPGAWGTLAFQGGCPLLPETACFENHSSLSSKSHWASNPPGLLFSWTCTWSTLWGALAQKTQNSLKWARPRAGLKSKTPGHLLSPRSAKMAEGSPHPCQRQWRRCQPPRHISAALCTGRGWTPDGVCAPRMSSPRNASRCTASPRLSD